MRLWRLGEALMLIKSNLLFDSHTPTRLIVLDLVTKTCQTDTNNTYSFKYELTFSFRRTAGSQPKYTIV
jgi:hypothetical protein